MSTTSTPTTSRTPRTGFIVCLVIAIALLIVSIIAYPHMAPELVTRPAGNGHGENSPNREFTAFVRGRLALAGAAPSTRPWCRG